MSNLGNFIFVLNESQKLGILWLVFLMKCSAKRKRIKRTVIDALSLKNVQKVYGVRILF